MVKTFKNLLLHSKKSYNLDPMHAASGTQAMNGDPQGIVDHDLFYGNVKFGRLCVSMGKTVT